MLVVIEHYRGEFNTFQTSFPELRPIEETPAAEAVYHGNFRSFGLCGDVNGKRLVVLTAGYGRSFGLAVSDYLNILQQKDALGLQDSKMDEVAVCVGCYSPSWHYELARRPTPGGAVVPSGVQAAEPSRDGSYRSYFPDELLTDRLRGSTSGFDGVATSHDGFWQGETEWRMPNLSWHYGWRRFARERARHLRIDWADYSTLYFAEACAAAELTWASVGIVREIYDVPEGIRAATPEEKTKFYECATRAIRSLL